MSKRLRILLVLFLTLGFMGLYWARSATPVLACNFDAGESWCGNCGYTCIQSWQSCPGTSQCGGGGSQDLRTVEPDTSTGGGSGVVPDGNGGYKPKATPTPAPSTPSGPTKMSSTEKQAAGSCGTDSFCGGTERAYRCVPLQLSNGECNIRCGMLTDAACVAGTGLKAGVRVEEHYYSVACDKVNTRSKTGACAEDEMTIPCEANPTKHQCVPFDVVRSAEQTGVKTDDEYAPLLVQVKLEDEYAFSPTTTDPTDSTKTVWYLKGHLGGVFDGGDIPDGQIVPWSANGANSCTPGKFQTVIIGGVPMTTQLGGDRSACGAAADCAPGEQRGCGSDGKLTAGCVQSDACAWQIQPLTAGQSCQGLTQLSEGEASKGKFVGCLGTQNCFCQNLSASSSIECYNDAGKDSCGAPGPLPEKQIITPQGADTPGASTEDTQTPTPTPNIPTPTPNVPTPTPTPAIGPQCDLITSTQGAPQLGEQVSFTCAGSPSDLIERYEFRYAVTVYQIDDQNPLSFTNIPTQQGKPDESEPITVDQIGFYVTQCRPCTANECLDWEPTSSIVNPATVNN